MQANTISLVQSTFAQIVPFQDEAARLFYEHLFALDPALAAMFPTDLEAQRCKLMTTLQFATFSLNKPTDLLPSVRAMGARHSGYGATSAHYATVRSALLWMFDAALGDDFTPAARNAWAEVIDLLSHEMREGAKPAV